MPPRRSECTTPFTLEQEYQAQGKQIIIGVDEVGYGAWAGPLVVGAVCLPMGQPDLLATLKGIKDSKQMTPRQREAAYEPIQQVALAWEVAQVEAQKIDELGLARAHAHAMEQAVRGCLRQLDCPVPDMLLLDGNKTWKDVPFEASRVRRIIQGERHSLSIACASVLAKVWRDRHMCSLVAHYPEYQFEDHKGYGTAKHRQALLQHGAKLGLHRLSYKPIRQLLYPPSF
ncbi:MAG: ribonuclease HII [Phototrophicaceae bacterium]